MTAFILPITAFYTALSALLLLYFSMQVIRSRLKYKVALQDGGIDALARVCRAHANFTEYAPLFLLLLLIGEAGESPSLLLHGLGSAFLLGRILHFYSLTQREMIAEAQGKIDIRFRTAGMVLTFGTLAIGALNALIIAIPHL